MANRDGRANGSPLTRNFDFLLTDILLIPLAAGFAFWLRLDWTGVRVYASTLLVFAIAATLLKPLVFWLFGLYRRLWRYAGANDLLHIALATLIGTALVTLLTYVLRSFDVRFPPLPRSIPIIDWLVSVAIIGGTRYSRRLAASYAFARLRPNGRRGVLSARKRRVLVMGAGEAGAMVVREMRSSPALNYVPVGLLDDNRAKVGTTVCGVPVRGTREDIPWLAKEYKADEVIIAIPSAPGRAMQDIVAICHKAGLACRTVPGIYELLSGQVSVKQLREVRIEDLLQRDPVRLDGTGVAHYLSQAVVLVSGAGGSIGSEMCRQIAHYEPRQLLLLGHGENSIYDIMLELRERFPLLATQAFIADVRDPGCLETIFATCRPGVVFHAAAHKHVPLMESNVTEAVMNNVLGTQNLLRLASTHDVARFVFISTDKAVNPTSIMGATKRLAELLVRDTAQRTGRIYVAVRFGNVLGSRGSVVPLFQRQIAAGGPLTVTHPEMRRFFMTIPEAVQLTLQAAALGQGGEVFVLNMGEPVRVVDLATELIRLCGFEPGRDIEITYCGIRPGEKLNESLFGDGESPQPTRHPKILVASGGSGWDSPALAQHIQDLQALAQAGDAASIRAKIQEILPEYRPLADGVPRSDAP
jgi:FlaA1/EpsC-like NDP-sugar epimerase